MTTIEGQNNQILGRFGEEKAADYLISEGYRVLERNFRCRQGEIDIIAEKDGYTVFAEVKLRKNSAYGYASEFVSGSKQRRIKTAAKFYLSCEGTEDCPLRFDIIEIYAPEGTEGKITINHMEDAFM
ncbi:MAG: YraN family protein [Eubacteriales bacterium]|nr:YraN family protein [Eubacteriales bacterium]